MWLPLPTGTPSSPHTSLVLLVAASMNLGNMLVLRVDTKLQTLSLSFLI